MKHGEHFFGVAAGTEDDEEGGRVGAFWGFVCVFCCFVRDAGGEDDVDAAEEEEGEEEGGGG